MVDSKKRHLVVRSDLAEDGDQSFEAGDGLVIDRKNGITDLESRFSQGPVRVNPGDEHPSGAIIHPILLMGLLPIEWAKSVIEYAENPLRTRGS
jgi:hypothetical protein